MAASQFRRSADAWIFRAPAPWVVGPRPHYLVNEAQKSTIETIVGVGYILLYLFVILAIVWFALYPGARIVNRSSQLEDHLLTFMLGCLSLGVLYNVYQYFALWPLLRRLPRTAEQITLVERSAPMARLSIPLLIFALLFLAAMMLFIAHGALKSHGWDPAAYIAIVAIGALGAYYGAALWVKRRLGRT